MKFTVPVQTILSPIIQVANICTSNSPNPDELSQYLLFDVKKDQIKLLGTDNTVQLEAVIPLPADACQEEGVFIIKANRVSDFFKCLGTNDDITVEWHEGDDCLTVNSDHGSYSLQVRPAPEKNAFPVFSMAEEDAPKTFEIEEFKLRYMIEKTVFCVSRDNYRDYLKGIRFEVQNDDLSVFALDGHRMAVAETKLENPPVESFAFLMTLRGVTELMKLLSSSSKLKLNISATDNYISTKVNCFTITNRLLKCKYPNVRGVLPKDLDPEVSVNLEQLKTYVKRISLFSNKRLNMINLTFTNNNLALYSQNSEHEVGKADIEINYPTELRREANLNCDFVKEFLNAIDTEDVIFGFAPPYNNTMLRPRYETNEDGLRLRYVVSHIMV